MKTSTRYFNNIVLDPWFLPVNGLSSIAAFLYYFYSENIGLHSSMSAIFLGCSLFVLTGGYVYSVKVRVENIALRSVFELLYEINDIYKDKLSEMFRSESPTKDSANLFIEEEHVLKAVCQRIEDIFARFTNRSCVVTVKLVTLDEDGKNCYAQTYVRSQEFCRRDASGNKRYLFGTGDNTAFDVALAKRPDGAPSHFHCADLRKLAAYYNERQHYQRFYKSTLVVPIRGRSTENDKTPEYDLIGFLCVDTQSVNRLNNGYHLYTLAALSSQMYNFMSLMRGRYTVAVGT